MKHYLFGKVVAEQAKECKKNIINDLNPLWPSELKRGQNWSQILHALRKNVAWPKDAIKKGETNHRHRIATINNRENIKMSKDGPRRAAIKAECINESLSKYSDSWYPEYWLPFVVCGVPAGEENKPHRCSVLLVGQAVKAVVTAEGISAAGRASRRAAQALEASGSKGKANPKRKPEVSLEEPELTRRVEITHRVDVSLDTDRSISNVVDDLNPLWPSELISRRNWSQFL